jgi:hypothetical protein
MSASPSTHGWEDFKPREADEGTQSGRQLASYDGEIRIGARRRTSGPYTDWVFVTVRQRSGIWTRLCLDDVGTAQAQGFGATRKAATLQMGQSLRARGMAAYRALDSDESGWR